jgi:hypothetical protein
MKLSNPWIMVLLAACAVAVFACRRLETVAASPLPAANKDELREQLNPVHQLPPLPARFTALPSPNPATITPVPIRSFLPQATTSDQPRLLPGDRRTAISAPFSSGEIPMLIAASTTAPILLAATPLAAATSPDPAHWTVWITNNPTPESRGRPTQWDRPQLTTDPTGEGSRALALAPPSGLRESPPPFLRISIPDPYEQITIAELRNPPPDDEAPVRSLSLPILNLVETTPAGK